MKKSSRFSALSSALVLALSVAMSGCGGGGGGGTTATAVTLSGTAATGAFSNADVKVYDATKGESSTPVTTLVTDSNGKYGPVQLPAGANYPLLIVVSSNTSSQMKDEVFGALAAPPAFKLRSVVPSGSLASSAVTAHVTPYTNLMYKIVENKVGQTTSGSSVDSAINQARNVVNQLTGNADPLTTDPVNDAGMVVKLAAISNMASGGANDPDNCAGQATDAEKVACTVDTLAKAVTPMGKDDDTSGGSYTLPLDTTVLSALAGATQSLDTTVVLANAVGTGFQKSDLDSGVTETAAKLTEVAAHNTVTIPDSATATGLQQAKEFFANLRTGVLPYANSLGTGFLDTEASSLRSEAVQLNAASITGLDVITKMVSLNSSLVDDSMPGECQAGQIQTGYTERAVCTYRNLTIVFDNNANTKQGAWTITGTGTTLKGKFSYDNTSMTFNGYVPPMLQGSERTKVGLGLDGNNGLDYPGYKEAPLVVSRNILSGSTYRYAVTGTMKDQMLTTAQNMSSTDAAVAGGGTCAPGATCSTHITKLKMLFGNITFDDNNPTTPGVADSTTATIDLDEANQQLVAMNLKGTFVTENYRFIGTFAIDSIQFQTSMYGGLEAVGGKASFTGTVNGKGQDYANYFFNLPGDTNTSNDFDLLVGKLESDWNGTSDTGTLTFTGTVKKSASDTGLKLIVTMSQTSATTGTLTVSYNDYNKGISVSGSGTYDDNSSATQYVTLSDGNGISVKIPDTGGAEVMKGGTKLADINGNRVTYTDGTYESLF